LASGRQYGHYTDGKSTISLDKNVICFDLKGLEKFERLQACMLTIVTNFVWGKIMSERAVASLSSLMNAGSFYLPLNQPNLSRSVTGLSVNTGPRPFQSHSH